MYAGRQWRWSAKEKYQVRILYALIQLFKMEKKDLFKKQKLTETFILRNEEGSSPGRREIYQMDNGIYTKEQNMLQMENT